MTELWLNRKNGKSTEKEQKQEQYYTVGQSLENCWSPGGKTESGNWTQPNSQLIFLAGWVSLSLQICTCVWIIALFVCLTNVFWSKNVYRVGRASVYTYIYWLLPAAVSVGGGAAFLEGSISEETYAIWLHPRSSLHRQAKHATTRHDRLIVR